MALLDRFRFRLQARSAETCCRGWMISTGGNSTSARWTTTAVGEARQKSSCRLNPHLLTGEIMVHGLPRLILRAGSGVLFLLFALGLPVLVLRSLRAGSSFRGNWRFSRLSTCSIGSRWRFMLVDLRSAISASSSWPRSLARSWSRPAFAPRQPSRLSRAGTRRSRSEPSEYGLQIATVGDLKDAS